LVELRGFEPLTFSCCGGYSVTSANLGEIRRHLL